MSSGSAEIAREQEYVTMLYNRLDALRERAAGRFAQVLRQEGGTRQSRTERDIAASEQADRLAQLDAAEDGLCFGQLDFGPADRGKNATGDGLPADPSERRYVGRLGIRDEGDDYEPLLIDWRAPAARPFYIATAAAPLGVRRRRHIKTRQRTVTGLDDDVLDLDALDGERDAAGAAQGLVGEGALLSAVTANRTGRMRDVVETIQAEQDHAIRAGLPGVLVVQGGPGTGKTAVALHRAAYLLYTHRERLARRGVLIVGPNPTFLRYISHVLPSLGETSAVLRTLGELFPGVVADRAEATRTGEIKGRAVMADVLAAALRARQRVPQEELEVEIDHVLYRLDRETCAEARELARGSLEPHNVARPALVDRILDALTEQVVRRLNQDPFGELTRELVAEIERDLRQFGDLGEAPLEEELLSRRDAAQIRRGLAEEPAVQAALDWLWPELTPQRLLADLFADRDLLEEAAAGLLTPDEQAALLRERSIDSSEADSSSSDSSEADLGEAERSAADGSDGGWSVADVPLLDEAAELLGLSDDRAEEEERRRRERQVAYAQGVLDILAGSALPDIEDRKDDLVTVTDFVTAEHLADEQDFRGYLTVADRAAADRTWTFGHVIVDEAQELSAMAWRVLMRRCPSRSMTIVGDVAQTGDLAGTDSWGKVLEPYVGDRWRLAQLTVNYRTPAEVMAVAAKVLARINPALEPPRSVRESGIEPWRESVPAAQLPARLGEVAAREAQGVGEGRLAVIVPADRAAQLAEAVLAAVPDAAYGPDPDLECRTVVLPVRQAKGLEFDTVLVVDPDAIAADPVRGDSDLYVALTRVTRRLAILETDD
ncbi:MAG TPA: ATP-binding domain-containing protein [Actinocrinis sp.]|nr:ATP-binding domain-containing protein [Actinocrinis sp.]HXR71364.1 ATP-binding domain-containing protein [Actinocrinis sp.]